MTAAGHDPAGEGARAGRRRRGPAGARDRAAAGRADDRLRRAARGGRAGPLARGAASSTSASRPAARAATRASSPTRSAPRQQQALTDAIKGFDVVITTALVPGRPAPKLVTAEAVEGMRPGSVIVDLAGEAGGNCELTEPGETVVAPRRHDRLAAEPARDRCPSTPRRCTRATSRRCSSCWSATSGELALDWDDEIVAGACVVRDGEIVNAGARARRGGRALMLAVLRPTSRSSCSPASSASRDLEGAEHAAHAADDGHQRDPRHRRCSAACW